MSEAYGNVVGGGLKLKGIGKKKKKKRATEEAEEAAGAVVAASSSSAAASSSSSSYTKASYTESEQRFLDVQKKRNVEKLQRGELKSHREQVKHFNDYLSNLTEHYDLPKVSKGN